MPELPERFVAASSLSASERRAILARREVESALLRAELAAHFDREAARIDAETACAASQSALDCELELLAWGTDKARAVGSAAAAKLVADRVSQLSALNSRNLGRRFS